MKSNGKLLLALGFVAAGGVLMACGDSSGTGGSGGSATTTVTSTTGSNTTTSSSKSSTTGTTSSTGTGGGFPAPPTLGVQIDRMGRPAINTATDETFLAVNGMTPTPSTTALREAAEDAYNAQSTPLDWTSNQKTMKAQLAILDALDTVCGNQVLACNDINNTGCYSALAGLLADDRLWLNTKATAACAQYLAVELGKDDCGGRRPVDDVIKTTYSAVAGPNATFDNIDDNITPPAGLHPTTFPYLAAPH